MKAVVLDFFGTLTDPSREAGRRAVYDATAAALGAPPDAFWTEVTQSFDERATGALGDTASTLRTIAMRCSVQPTPEQLATAVAAQHRGAQSLHAPRPGALDVLEELRSRGFGLALLSDCSSELCEMWDDSVFAGRFDATVFSWTEGFRKPDPRGFAKAAKALGVAPVDCWYVGDGASREMTGALTAGMRPVLIANAAYGEYAQYRYDPDAFVPQDVVDDIVDVLTLVGSPS